MKNKELIKRKRKIKPSLLIVLFIILIVTIVSQLAFLSVFGTKGKEVAKIRSEQKRLILDNELLDAEICNKQSLVRIKDIASLELGMVTIDKIEYVTPYESISSKN
jgi:flagellar basal body-associated protein FliL